MEEKNYSHRCFLPMNGLQDRTPYDGHPVGNNPKFMPLENSLNRDILHSLRFHCILSHFVLDGEGTDEEERNMQFSFSTPREIAQAMKRIWESKMGTPSSARIIEDVSQLQIRSKSFKDILVRFNISQTCIYYDLIG